MKPIRCLLTDDEPLALDVLASYIGSLDSLTLVGRCNNAIETINFLRRHPVDLLFLDIEMPRLTGIDLLKTLPHPPRVIFTTAYREYALEGYELNVLDYLLKPISFERFLMAVNKFPQQPIQVNSSASSHAEAQELDFLYVKAQKKMFRIEFREVLYIESLRDYIRIRTTSREIITHANISQLAEKLPADRFLRIHRSFIVSLDKIRSFSTTNVEVSGKELPIGRLYRPQVAGVLQTAPSL